ncbi:protein kinase-like protein [Xylariomycetidae sp. FL0641]|nr:protein kinase-like protein [Xylariomycetidae sp. FL0641]
MAYQNHEGGTTSRLSRNQVQDRYRQLANDIPELQKFAASERVAILFDDIGCRHVITAALQSGVTDLWIPIPKISLPMGLNPGAFLRFRQNQDRFLSSSFEVDPRWPGPHHNLAPNATDGVIPRTLRLDGPGMLGSGGTADVAQVKCPSGKVYALKRIQRVRNFHEAKEQMRYVQMELGVLRRIRNKHYIRLVGSYTDKDYIGILMHPVADSNLQQYLENFGPHDAPVLAGFFGCLATALANLHYVWHIRHKDIKPQNILVKDRDVLFTDFGISLDWTESGHTTTKQEQRRSPKYCAPEAAEDRARNSMTDIWSLGCVFLEMAAVLKGWKRRHVEERLKQFGPSNFRESTEGVAVVIADLKRDTSRCGNAPLDWAEKMLQREKERRPTSRDLRSMILQNCDQSGLVFCGLCCTGKMPFDKEDGDEDDDEDADDTYNRSYKAMAGSIGDTAEDLGQPLVDEERQKAISILNPRACSLRKVNVVLEDGCSENWISPSAVRLCQLQVREGQRLESMTFQGEKFESRTWVTLTWKGSRPKTQETDCVVGPSEVPFEFVGGQKFIAEFGWQNL